MSIKTVKQWKSGVQFEIIEYGAGMIEKVKRNKDDRTFIRNNSVMYENQEHYLFMFHEDCINVWISPKASKPEYGIEFYICPDSNKLMNRTVKLEPTPEDMHNKKVPINELILLGFNFPGAFSVGSMIEDIQ